VNKFHPAANVESDSLIEEGLHRGAAMTTITQPKIRDCFARHLYVQTLGVNTEMKQEHQPSITRNPIAGLGGSHVPQYTPGTLKGARRV
jgi:hypothetical protein